MRARTFTATVCALLACLLGAATAPLAQRGGMFLGSANDPAIRYIEGPLDNAIERLNARLDAGSARLTYDGRHGYLRSAVEALGLPVDSQLLLFSQASLQGRRVSPTNPRALFFDDDIALGWVRDAELLEVAVQDASKGTVFYTLEQKEVEQPRFKRATICLGCHMTGDTFGVPGLLMFTSVLESEQTPASATFINDSTPVTKRFGGWFVTGAATPAKHQGKAVPSTEGLYDPEGYLAQSSDIAALMVFAHQAQALNLMIRASWQARVWDPALHPGAAPADETLLAPVLRVLADDVVDSLLFVDEAPLEGRLQGRSGFAERFAAAGPRDRGGRSLRELDLTRRLMRYPCSYLIYSRAFDAMPPAIKTRVYQRLWQILSGEEQDPRYRKLTLADRRAIVEILRETKPDLPSFFVPVVK